MACSGRSAWAWREWVPLPMGKLIQLRIARFSVFLALRGTVHLPLRGSVQHATADLIQLDRFEQCLEVALTKALVAPCAG